MHDSKNIINEQPKQILEDKKPISVSNETDEIIITIQKKFINENTNYDILRLFTVLVSPLFTNQEKSISNKENILVKSKIGYKHIAFFIENRGHYTGGRYSLVHQAVLLSNYTQVTIVTNQEIDFINDFRDMVTDNLSVVVSSDYLLSSDVNDFDLIFGIPLMSGHYAHSYAKKHNLSLYLMMFETPNWVKKYRDGADSTEEYWSDYKRRLLDCDKIIVPSFESKKYLLEWLTSVNEKQVDVIYPCINEIKADSSKRCVFEDNKINVLFLSRMIPGKSPVSIIKKTDKNRFRWIIIGKIWKISKDEIKKLVDNGYEIIIFGSVDDKDKFEIIKGCDVLAFPTHFEGFGMPPMEALYCGIPVITYSLPVLKEIYGNSKGIFWVDNFDENVFVEKLKGIIKGGIGVQNIVPMKETAKKLLDVFEIPKITTGTIVYNGSDFIEYSIGSLKNIAYKIVIIDGAVEGYNNELENGRSKDGTIQKINEMIKKDYLGKIELVLLPDGQRVWPNKIVMQNQIYKCVPDETDYYIKLDHDEVWKSEDAMNCVNLMINDFQVKVLKMKFHHFWTSFDKVTTDEGGKWSTIHPRIWKWKIGLHHRKTFNQFVTQDGVLYDFPFYKDMISKIGIIYHFGYVRSTKAIQEKIKYYNGRKIESYADDTYSNWTEGENTQPSQCRDTISKVVSFNKKDLPKILIKHPFYNLSDVRR